MEDRKFFASISDIKRIAPLKLEELLEDSPVSKKGNRLFFTYWVNMEPYEEKPLLVDNEGQFWIGKKSGNFVFEEYGRSMSEFLFCPSPEVEYYRSNGSSQVLSKFIHPSRDPTLEELKNRGQITLVPRLLVAYSREITDNKGRLSGRLDCDINRGQFLVDSNDIFYQIDFSRPVEEVLTLNGVKGKLNLFGLTADQDNEVIKKQVAQIKQYDFKELYQAFTQRARQLLPKRAEQYLPIFLWNFNNIDRLLHTLHMSSGYRPVRFIIHSNAQLS